MTRQSLTRIAAGAAVAGMVALGAGPASALPHPSSSTPSTSSTSVPGGAPSGQAGTTGQAGPSTQAANQAKVLTFLQNAGESDVNARLASLNKVISDLGNVPQGCDVSALITNANNAISGLTTLEGNLKAATTVTAAKALVQQIFAGFRVYALMIPVDEMVVATCRMGDVINKVNALVTKLQGVKDPNITALVTDMGNNAHAAADALNGVANALEGFDAQSWDQNHTELLQYRQDIRTARKDLEQCRDDAHKIVMILHHDNGGGNEGNNVNPNANTNASSSSTSSTSSSTTSSTVAA